MKAKQAVFKAHGKADTNLSNIMSDTSRPTFSYALVHPFVTTQAQARQKSLEKKTSNAIDALCMLQRSSHSTGLEGSSQASSRIW